ncbi:serpin family protein [Stenomitos frigidus]|uniref:Proteinase inhibitor I4 serpin n=1 Tax=Stenomitos frigidus ULC18 TaxID=2107698 RepID=A0A2T1EED0_9CYAN|nr:serpin family protein [Stenomitos frigidus]PSB31090.1 proteinase inhibitor I4 serpin [Stenomitos frigidus ULC18]
MSHGGLRRTGAIAIGSLMLLGLMGCLKVTSVHPATASPQPTQLPQQVAMQKPQTVDPKLVTANTTFSFKLFSELLKQESNQNVFVSPSSVAIALSMAYNGASGTTQQQMSSTLELQGMSLNALNQGNANLKALLENPDTGVQLAMANSLWARQGVPFQPTFIQRNQKFYGAQVTDLDFGAPNATATINGWVKENTRGKISQIVDSLKPDDVMFLINAIYFKGSWTKAFNKSDTTDKPFYLVDGRQKRHPMMAQTGSYKYYENEQFQAVSLPYGTKRVSMYIFLPKQASKLSSFAKTLTAENWQRWMSQFRTQPGSVQVPRFKLEYDVELKKALSALGMPIAFDARKATFDALSTVPTKIDQVKHKTFVEVNEEGTEAAAATSIGIVATSMPTNEPFQMVVDRPFFCAIRDNKTGTVLFMGAIVDPK